jgi:glutamate-ammonia-ligase adenylyltransferase
MGKCGGRELNYVSDVDVIFVAAADDDVTEEVALRVANQLSSAVIRTCSDYTGEGTIWPVDAGLRPEGKAGPLARSLPSHLGYYQRWAKTWEFQALLKARPVAGDPDLGERYMEAIGPLVWQASERDGFVSDVQAMRRRVLDAIPGDQAARQLKLGPGGLRDVEFAVQLLQLVHGRTDPTLRSPSTLVALDSLTAGGYVGREDGATMASAYRFLRSLEHRIQLWQLRRTHVVPDSADALRRLGRSLGFTREPVEELTREWKRHTREVRRLHEKLFYRPLLTAVARLPGDEVRLSTDAARERLNALGYVDPSAALRHIESLTEGLSRRASIQRTLLPAMLEWFADAPDPDAGLLAFRQVSDSLGSTHWYLRLLRDEGLVATRMARVLSASRYATDLLMRAPEAVAMLSDDEDLRPRTREQLESEMTAAAERYDDPVACAQAVRAVRRRELLRLSMSDLLDLVDVEEVAAALSEIAICTLAGGLLVALRSIEVQRAGPLPTRLAVIAMGRLGGHELSYGSDADVMFVHSPLPGVPDRDASEAATTVVTELQGLLGSAGSDPPVRIDTDLRPEGRQGPLVRSLASYAAYYQRWSKPWEAQALIRAEPACGDVELRRAFRELIDPLRFPVGGLTPDSIAEIRRVKARVDAERLPRAADPATHTKLGPGGLADIEWTVQLLQLRHGAVVPGLRTTQTLPALWAAESAGLVARADAQALTQAWRLATRVRNAIVLVRGRPSDSLPRAVRERAGVAYVCGYGVGEAERLVDDYRRTTRRASAVIDRLFWG